MQGVYEPGRQLSLRAIADEVHTSVAPVREAVSRLAALNAVRIHPKRYIEIPVLSGDEYFHFVEVRKLLEGHAIMRACAKMSDQSIAEAVALNKRFESNLAEGRVDQAMEVNQAFHFLIYGNAGSPVLLETIENIWLRIGPSLHSIYAEEVRMSGTHPLTNNPHRKLLIALHARNGEAALRELAKILDIASDMVIARLRRHSDASLDSVLILSDCDPKL